MKLLGLPLVGKALQRDLPEVFLRQVAAVDPLPYHHTMSLPLRSTLAILLICLATPALAAGENSERNSLQDDRKEMLRWFPGVYDNRRQVYRQAVDKVPERFGKRVYLNETLILRPDALILRDWAVDADGKLVLGSTNKGPPVNLKVSD